MPDKIVHKLHIKNMVCQRCILAVQDILRKHEIEYQNVTLGEAILKSPVSDDKLKHLEDSFSLVGFELITGRVNKLVEDIKVQILNYLSAEPSVYRQNLSSYITSAIPYEYSYLSDLFSSVNGITIEQYFITTRIEKVKELIVYDQLSLTEIAYQCGFSSVHHLSAQFRKVTGLTPSHFRKVGSIKRKSIDTI